MVQRLICELKQIKTTIWTSWIACVLISPTDSYGCFETHASSVFFVKLTCFLYCRTFCISNYEKAMWYYHTAWFLIYLFIYSNTLIFSIWWVWGNKSTGCTSLNLKPSSISISMSLAIVIGLQEIYSNLNWYCFFRLER